VAPSPTKPLQSHHAPTDYVLLGYCCIRTCAVASSRNSQQLNQNNTMPFAIYNSQESKRLPLYKGMLSSSRFQPFPANLRSSDPEIQQNLWDNPLFEEAVSRIRLLHEFSLDHERCSQQEAKLTALAACSKKDSTSQLLFDVMVLWSKKMLKVRSLSEIMEKCTQEMGSKLVPAPFKSSNPPCAETPYSESLVCTIM
jgi:hypothetical protein